MSERDRVDLASLGCAGPRQVLDVPQRDVNALGGPDEHEQPSPLIHLHLHGVRIGQPPSLAIRVLHRLRDHPGHRAQIRTLDADRLHHAQRLRRVRLVELLDHAQDLIEQLSGSEHDQAVRALVAPHIDLVLATLLCPARTEKEVAAELNLIGDVLNRPGDVRHACVLERHDLELPVALRILPVEHLDQRLDLLEVLVRGGDNDRAGPPIARDRDAASGTAATGSVRHARTILEEPLQRLRDVLRVGAIELDRSNRELPDVGPVHLGHDPPDIPEVLGRGAHDQHVARVIGRDLNAALAPRIVADDHLLDDLLDHRRQRVLQRDDLEFKPVVQLGRVRSNEQPLHLAMLRLRRGHEQRVRPLIGDELRLWHLVSIRPLPLGVEELLERAVEVVRPGVGQGVPPDRQPLGHVALIHHADQLVDQRDRIARRRDDDRRAVRIRRDTDERRVEPAPDLPPVRRLHGEVEPADSARLSAARAGGEQIVDRLDRTLGGDVFEAIDLDGQPRGRVELDHRGDDLANRREVGVVGPDDERPAARIRLRHHPAGESARVRRRGATDLLDGLVHKPLHVRRVDAGRKRDDVDRRRLRGHLVLEMCDKLKQSVGQARRTDHDQHVGVEVDGDPDDGRIVIGVELRHFASRPVHFSRIVYLLRLRGDGICGDARDCVSGARATPGGRQAHPARVLGFLGLSEQFFDGDDLDLDAAPVLHEALERQGHDRRVHFGPVDRDHAELSL